MTRQDLQRWEAELGPLVPREGASPLARENARAFNADAGDVKDVLLEPAEHLLEEGAALDDLAPCLEKEVAELAFWRRVLSRVYGEELATPPPRPDYLVTYLLS
jgi:hypothetical protein